MFLNNVEMQNKALSNLDHKLPDYYKTFSLAVVQLLSYLCDMHLKHHYIVRNQSTMMHVKAPHGVVRED